MWLAANPPGHFASSSVHYDMNQQVMCQLDGVKEWFFFAPEDYAVGDPSRRPAIPMWSGYYHYKAATRRYEAYSSDDSPVDPERVNLHHFPHFANARWWNTTVGPGDCVFVPAGVLHYVRSYGRRNIGVTAHFDWHTRGLRDLDAVPPALVARGISLNKFDTLWTYPGEFIGSFEYARIKMGWPDWTQYLLEVLRDLYAHSP